MDQGLETILAEEIKRRPNGANYTEPNVEPGMIVESHQDDTTNKGVVTKIVFDPKQSSCWAISVQGVRCSVESYGCQAVGLSNVLPDIRAGEVYDLNIQRGYFSPKKLISKLIGGKLPQTERIKARVVTQSSIASDSLVYLADMSNKRLFAVDSQTLPKRDRPKQEFIPGETITKDKPERPSPRSERYQERDPPPQPEVVKETSPPSRSIKTAYSSPRDISTELEKTILHQDAAIRSISVAAYDHLVRSRGIKKSNAIIIGSTGTGKTELARTIAGLFKVPYAEAKLAGLTASGFIGQNVESVFLDLYAQRKNPNVGRSIIFLDEIDKLVETVGSNHAGFGPTLQNQLIGWTESANVQVPLDSHATFDVDTTDMLFIGAGAFVGLEGIIAERLGKKVRSIGFDDGRGSAETGQKSSEESLELYEQVTPDDLVRFGLKPELIGRFPIITYTKLLRKEDLIDIAKRSGKSAFNQQLALLKQGYGVSADIDEQVYGIVADAALNLETGARGLEATSNRLFEKVKFDGLDSGRTAIKITPEMAYEALKRLLPKDYKI